MKKHSEDKNEKGTVGNLLLGGALTHLGAGALSGIKLSDDAAALLGASKGRRIGTALGAGLIGSGLLAGGYNRLKKALTDSDENIKNGHTSKTGVGLSGTAYAGLALLTGLLGSKAYKGLRALGSPVSTSAVGSLSWGIPALAAAVVASKKKQQYAQLDKEKKLNR